MVAVESINNGVESGTAICGSEKPTGIFNGSGGMEETRMIVVIGEDGGEFILKISEKGVQDVGGLDTFGIGSVGVGSEVAPVSSTSL